MRIIEQKHIHGTEKRDGYIAIPELDREKPSARQFIKLANLDIELKRPTAFLYVDGFSISQAEHGMTQPARPVKTPVLKMGSSYIAHEWVHTFKNKENLKYVNIISSTCAAGIQALFEAEQLLESGTVDEVVIISAERTTPDTIRLFKELRIPVTCGDGFAFVRVERGPGIRHIKWKFTYQQNPFFFPRSEIDTLAPSCPVDFVKLHGTGTKSNTEAESGLAELGQPIIYKDRIGHTQGASALVELCMLMEDDRAKGNCLIAANGAGGFYGSAVVKK